MMSKRASLHFNDDIGELSQQFALGGERKKWVMKCLNVLAKKNSKYKKMHGSFVNMLSSKRK